MARHGETARNEGYRQKKERGIPSTWTVDDEGGGTFISLSCELIVC